MAVALPDQEARRAWSAVLDRARTELPETTFLMWFTDVRPIALHDQVLSLAVPSQFVRERLQHNHLGLIEETAEEAFGHPVKIEMDVDEGIRHEEGPLVDITSAPPAAYAAIGAPATARRRCGKPLGAPGLPFPNYTFDAFVPGPVEPVRARRRHGGRRGTAVDRVQPAVHLRGHGPRQDAPPGRDRASHLAI